MTTIRHATSADLPQAADLAVLHSGGERPHWQARFAEELVRPGSCLLIADSRGRVAGYGRVRRFDPSPHGPANLAPAGYYLGGIVVDPAHRRQGIGDQLTRARMAWTAPLASEIWYFTNAGNQASLRLHRRLGFREVTRDFTYPGVAFTGGIGVLCRAPLVSEDSEGATGPSDLPGSQLPG